MIVCLPFPTFSTDKRLLSNRSCHIIEPYDSGELISAFVKREGDGFVIKTLDKDGRHIGPDEAGPIDKDIAMAINVTILLKVNQFQLFFSIKDKPILVDVFDGKTFISPGMLSDVYGKRMNIQNTISVEKFDPDKKYDAVIKPTIVQFNNQEPIYIKS